MALFYESPDDGQERQAPGNFVSLARVGQDESDPSRAFCYVDDSGQVLVEVTLEPDGDKVQAYLCLAQTGPNAGDFIPVRPDEAVLVVFPAGDPDQAYIVGRLDDESTNLAPTVCGLSTTGPAGQVRQYRWLVTPSGQVYAVQAGGEILLQGGGAGVRIKGAQVLVDGATHLGADFASAPIPGQVAGGGSESAATAAGPFVPPQGTTLTTPPWAGNRDAIVRVKDGVQSNSATDPTFWTWKQALEVYLTAVDVFVNALSSLNPGTIAAALLVYQAARIAYAATPVPTAIEAQHKAASATHTAAD
jgi:hypothetical protein